MASGIERADVPAGRRIFGLIAAVIVIAAGGFVAVSLTRSETPAGTETPKTAQALAGLACVAVDSRDRVYLGGAFGVKVLGPDLQVARQWATKAPLTALAVDEAGNVYAASVHYVEKFDASGRPLLKWGRGGCVGDEFSYVSGLAVHGQDLFVADSGARSVYRFTTDGRLLNDVGGRAGGAGEGFVVPSPILDCAAAEGFVYVNNPGVLQIEKYTYEGKKVGAWGMPGSAADEFPGCCNPVSLALAPDGRFVTGQKGEPAVKVWTAEGRLIAVIGAGDLSPDLKSLDIAVDRRGRVFCADPSAGRLRVYGLPKEEHRP